jgi:hypothetical protein
MQEGPDNKNAEVAKRVRYTRHAQVAMDGCDPEICQDKKHWLYEPIPGLDWNTCQVDAGEIALAIIEKYGLQDVHEALLRARATGQPVEDPNIILKVQSLGEARANQSKP